MKSLAQLFPGGSSMFGVAKASHVLRVRAPDASGAGRYLGTLIGLCALAAAPAHAGLLRHKPSLITHETLRLDDWRLDIARNRFSGAIACRLRARNARAFYRAGAVGFRFDPAWDVAQAVYRIDGGAPRAMRDDLPDLIALGVPLDRGGMENSGGGLVWIALATLRPATTIVIAPRPDGRPVTMHIRGMVGLHDLAVTRGCASDASFVE